MKLPITISLVFFASMTIISCKKDQVGSSTIPSKILGKWNLVNEEFTWVSGATGKFHDSIYVGAPDDYYEFATDSNHFAAEGIFHDTAIYYFVNSNQIQIKPSTWSGVSVSCSGGCFGPEFTIRAMTEHSLILSSSALTPEGPVSDSVTLKR
jgi:hypothetical protein